MELDIDKGQVSSDVYKAAVSNGTDTHNAFCGLGISEAMICSITFDLASLTNIVLITVLIYVSFFKFFFFFYSLFDLMLKPTDTFSLVPTPFYWNPQLHNPQQRQCHRPGLSAGLKISGGP